jgi:CrcB protein
MPTALNLTLIAFGGAIGALCRYWLGTAVHTMWPTKIPYGTLFINVSGSIVLGILYVLVSERQMLPMQWRPLAMVGFLGAFTTFSTFSVEVVNLIDNGHQFHAATYLLLSVVLAIGGAALGIWMTRHI